MKYFFGFHNAIILPGTKGCETKHYTLFHHNDSKRTRAQQIATNNSSDIDFDEFKSPHINFNADPCLLLIADITLPSNDALRLRKNLLEGV